MNQRLRILLTALLFLALNIKAYSQEMPYNRHFIIVVDQTIKSNNANMMRIYKAMTAWLSGNDPSQYLNVEGSSIPTADAFNPQQDAISLFAFGMTGNGLKGTGEFWRIHQQCYLSKETPSEAFTDITRSLIHKRARYINGQQVAGENSKAMSLDDFIKSDMQPLFNNSDPLHKLISSQSGVTMSHFIYPLIMNFVSKEETANEYYLILVSDFKSGQYSNNDQEDWNTFNGITAGKKDYRSYFEHQLNVMRSPFVQADFLHFQSGDIGARGTRLMYKGVISKTQLYLGSNLNLDQSSGSKFNLSKALITFDKDKNTTIDSIGVALYEGDKLLCYKTITHGDEEAQKLLTSDGRVYQIPAQDDLNLGESSLGDITVKYIFFTMSHDSDGNNVLPVSLTSQQTIEASSITYINVQKRKVMTIILVALIVIAIVVFLFWRGRKKVVSISISNFAQKYIDVTNDRGTVELPCWFYVKGNERNKVKVHGTISTVHGSSLKGHVSLFVRLQEAKPDGFSYFINGDSCQEFTKISHNNGEFEFDLDVTFNPQKIDPSKLHHCSIMIDFLVETSIFKKVYHSDIGLSRNEYEFFFIEDLGRSWVGFDPGTSGSCMAIGSPTGALANPSIAMVEAQSGTGYTEIIPSRLYLDNDLAGRDLKNLVPGIDYKYGVTANRTWGAAIEDHYPRFQSIKKLLGYKKGKNDRLAVQTKNGPIYFTGVDIASLLVKGLEKDLVTYSDSLPEHEKMRLEGGRVPKRAVVAIPNNYTLPKIQDMIESVRRLGQYKEIRFIYEAEGILFNYLRKTFKNSANKSSETIMVYDMGGATINLSVFRINYIHKNGSTYYNISTLGRIGYGVGGDNIDVALMEYILKWLPVPAKTRREMEIKSKSELLSEIFRLKKNIIYAFDTTAAEQDEGELDVLYNKDRFTKFVYGLLKIMSLNTKVFNDMTGLQKIIDKGPDENFANYIVNEILNSEELQEYVYSKVDDAVNEMLSYPDVAPLAKIDNLLFAGRSTMFPFIRGRVINIVRKKKSKGSSIVKFDDNKDEIKTAVAYGACWYGIYNGLVTLDNSRLSSSYGFKLTTNNDTTLDIMLDQNSRFGDDNMCHGFKDINSLFDADGQTVSFYQIMGSGRTKNIFDEKNRYKVNYLVGIPVTQMTKNITIDVGRNNVATCSVTFDTGITDSRTDIDIETRDIASENDWAYVFATMDEDNEASLDKRKFDDDNVADTSSYKKKSTSNAPTVKKQEKATSTEQPQWKQTTWSDGRKKRF